MKTCLTTILAALAVATPLTAQMSFGVRGGMTLSTLAVSEDDDEYFEVKYQHKSGLHVGATAAMGSGGPGALLSAAYSQRGTALALDPVSGLDPGDDFDFEGSIDLAYVDIGAFGRIPIGAGPYLLVGPTLSLRVACSFTTSFQGTTETEECRDDEEDSEDDPVRTNDFGVSGGVGMSFDLGGRNLVVEALYGYGILNLTDDDDDDDWARNRGFTIRAGLDFGG